MDFVHLEKIIENTLLLLDLDFPHIPSSSEDLYLTRSSKYLRQTTTPDPLFKTCFTEAFGKRWLLTIVEI